jgi:protein-S-isoprenylcysteine O-methyltransferase Ste14
MSIEWIARVGSLLVLFSLVGASARLLGDRRRYQEALENTPLAVLTVALFNACCYLATGIPPDPGLFHRPQFLETGAVVWGFPGLGGLLLALGFSFLGLTVIRRRAIGGQDTQEGLITSGTYRFCRHPIYLGIVLISLAIALIARNFDGLLVFPLVLLANLTQASIEERHDVGVRFAAEYQSYQRKTSLFGPVWFWAAVLGTIACLSLASSLTAFR